LGRLGPSLIALQYTKSAKPQPAEVFFYPYHYMIFFYESFVKLAGVLVLSQSSTVFLTFFLLFFGWSFAWSRSRSKLTNVLKLADLSPIRP
jgi:hypothetical protein